MTQSRDESGQRGTRCGLVALLGWTNVGKSTLLNRLVGTKVAAVAEASQTTRRRISGVLTLEGRGQVVFVDTPGFHRPQHRMNRAMIRVSRETLAGVDLAVQVLDAACGLGPGDAETATMLRGAAVQSIAVLNKTDRVTRKAELLPMMRTVVEDWRFPEVFPISALSGEGCEELLARILELLPVRPPLFPGDYLTDEPERLLAAEWIREKLLRQMREELPHATAVLVESWRERDERLEIDATVFVERESQKAIVIGREGRTLKTVGTEARLELERFLETPVVLKLWVKVRKGWRDDRRALRELGLS